MLMHNPVYEKYIRELELQNTILHPPRAKHRSCGSCLGELVLHFWKCTLIWMPSGWVTFGSNVFLLSSERSQGDTFSRKSLKEECNIPGDCTEAEKSFCKQLKINVNYCLYQEVLQMFNSQGAKFFLWLILECTASAWQNSESDYLQPQSANTKYLWQQNCGRACYYSWNRSPEPRGKRRYVTSTPKT